MTTAISWPDPATIAITGKTYKTPDGDFPRVTSVLKLLGTSTDALVKWSANSEREAVLEAARTVWPNVYGGPDEYVTALETKLGPARSHQRQLAKAADIGSSIHQEIQWTLQDALGLAAGPPPVLSDQSLWGFMAWEDWWKSSGLRPVRIEQPVWDTEAPGYAGTIDLIAEGPEGLEVLDWKTSKGVYESHHLQVAAYRKAAENWCGRIVRARIARLPKVIGDPEPQIIEHGDLWGGRKLAQEQMFSAFRSCLNLWNLLVKETK